MALKNWDRFGVGQPVNGWENTNNSGWIYIYNKGWFRGREDKYVVSTTQIGGSNPSDRINKGFKTKAQANRFAKSWRRSH